MRPSSNQNSHPLHPNAPRGGHQFGVVQRMQDARIMFY